MKVSAKQIQRRRKQTCREKGGGGQIGSLGLADANYYINTRNG